MKKKKKKKVMINCISEGYVVEYGKWLYCLYEGYRQEFNVQSVWKVGARGAALSMEDCKMMLMGPRP